MPHLLTALLCLTGVLAAATAATKALAVPNSDCLDCHEAEFRARKEGQPKDWIGVRPEVFAQSVHGKVNGVDYHAGITDSPHPLEAAAGAVCRLSRKGGRPVRHQHPWHEP